MTRITFTGARPTSVEATPGDRLLDVAQAAGQQLEGTCGGVMACATCHVVLAAEVAALLPPASDAEEDLLDLVPGATRHSRLACQVRVVADASAWTVHVPA